MESRSVLLKVGVPFFVCLLVIAGPLNAANSWYFVDRRLAIYPMGENEWSVQLKVENKQNDAVPHRYSSGTASKVCDEFEIGEGGKRVKLTSQEAIFSRRGDRILIAARSDKLSRLLDDFLGKIKIWKSY